MRICCEQDARRDEVRRLKGWTGLDYVEIGEDQRTLSAYFLGNLPAELVTNKPGIEKYLRLEGGVRVTSIAIVDVDPVVDGNPETDDHLVVHIDAAGDFSTYTLRLVGLKKIDPRYDHVDFSFKVDCPSELDCRPDCACDPPVLAEPEINYLAKDYASFRQLLLDRLAVLLPGWTERNVPDLGITLVELLAYTGDYLSYYQDAVATEAYLDTARQRISVRRHVRLIDYVLHEGCNARAWVCLEVGNDLSLDLGEAAFITGLNDALMLPQTVLSSDDLDSLPADSYEAFEPLVADPAAPFELRTAHNEIRLYTWGDRECCLERGSTSATLLDAWDAEPPAVKDRVKIKEEDEDEDDTGYQATEADQCPPDGPDTQVSRRMLALQPGDVVILEEVIGPGTGLSADADPLHRHAVRLTAVTPGEDPVVRTDDGRPTPYLRVVWASEDALPFPFCVSTLGPAPECRFLDNVSVARGNVVLVDHGATRDPEALGQVPLLRTESVCRCEGHPGDSRLVAGRFGATLAKTPLTHRQPLPADEPHRSRWVPAAVIVKQDVLEAEPQVWLSSDPPHSWQVRRDLLSSDPRDHDYVVEIDDDGLAHLRFGDGESAVQPAAGADFRAAYRIGNGRRGNVGAEAITRLVLRRTRLRGQSLSVRNPLPAVGGADAELTDEAKLFAPHIFRKRIERAVIANDYRVLAERNARVQRASADLVWTGSWYEADVAIDPLSVGQPDDGLDAEIAAYLHPFRRIGHDLHVLAACYVPLHLELEVCVLPHHDRGHVKAALLDVFSNRALPGGRRGFFHPDRLTFGGGVFLSTILAAGQAVPGVDCVRVVAFHRQLEPANHEIDNGVLALRSNEIAQLDNDPVYPERGSLVLRMMGGR